MEYSWATYISLLNKQQQEIRSLRLTGAFSQQELYNNWQAYQKLKIQIDLI